MSDVVNVAARMVAMARQMPDAVAVAAPRGRDRSGRRHYDSITFRELDCESDRLARGLRTLGVAPGARMALLVKPSINFVTLVFALLKAGAVSILIDPGMGGRSLFGCLKAAQPDGFVAIPLAHAVRKVLGSRFRQARFNVTVGPRWFWDGATMDQLRGGPWSGSEMAATRADDPAAVIFTSGSTGPAKGVLYTHGNFDRQVTGIRDFYGIRAGEVDLAGFPLFGLFNSAMGVTTVIPDMDASHPARVNPAHIVEAVRDWQVTQSFGSPAIWRRVGPYCAERGIRLHTLRRVMSAGAPLPPGVLARMKACIHPEGDVHTPYGATEALPVSSISASEVLAETAELTRQGGGTCVGRKFAGIEWKVIRAVDGPLKTIADAEELPPGEIGELIVSGPVVTRRYVTRVESNALAKIGDGLNIWHRLGDVGYLDQRERFWYCGRLSQRVQAACGALDTDRCESIFNQHPQVSRCALVGIGPRGNQRPVVVVELLTNKAAAGAAARQSLIEQLRGLARARPCTAGIDDFLVHPSLPVDVRHNAKIAREELAVWAARRLRGQTPTAGSQSP